ncbi:SURF1 family protein [Aliiroseovarius sp. KMU-50]|uniref:SURF1-like protein n=1 Tax=Aliiroseovarius salicola TaxID=3009082 RepID=A0ABT4W087_9RHOB|nr:SURF1 family protein [Aliiroseovarius sp. KMU-50]MDA5093844.1 SURF1 family protein [Aliiroseovarius sp. KMU-50]
MNWKFIIAAFLSMIVLAIFVSLGTWQLSRLEEKVALIAKIEAKIGADPVDLPKSPDAEQDKYLPVFVSGSFDENGVFILASTRDFGAGHRVVSAFVMPEGRRILVDRGFVPVQSGRPDLEASVPMTLTGNVHWPDERDSYTPEDDIAGNIWFARDVDKLARHLNTEPILIVARDQTDPAIKPMPVTSSGIPNRHLEYVGTWFLLAITWSVMTGFALWRMKRRRSQSGPHADA